MMRRPDPEEQKAALLTKAAVDGARLLGLSPGDAAAVLGVQPGAYAAMKDGKRFVDGTTGEAENADALVRIVRRLHALLGNGETAWRAWIRRESPVLHAKPLDLMRQRHGCLRVAEFLQQATNLT